MPSRCQLIHGYELLSDGRTVWVNGPSGGLVGRFSKNGIDIHHPVEIQVAAGKVCAMCKPGPTNLIDWYAFCNEMINRYGVYVGDKHMPTFLKVSGGTRTQEAS
jgi:hypothetical protein